MSPRSPVWVACEPSGILEVPCRCQEGTGEPLTMPGPAGTDDPALEQARLAQLAPRAYADAWLCRHTASAGAPRPAPHAQAGAVQGVTPPVMQQVAQRAGDAEAGAFPTRAGPSGATAADGSVQTAEAKQAARPKPFPPTLAPAQRDAAMSRAR